MSARFELPLRARASGGFRAAARRAGQPVVPDHARDVVQCMRIMRQGSRSFRAAAMVLPERVRGPATVVYAFCRIGDDAIDQANRPRRGLERMRHRLDAIMEGRPEARAVDRALARVVRTEELPRAPFDMLLEGFTWDVEGRRYETASDLVAYSVRVAGSVGVLMSCLMGRRAPDVLKRACALGVAMQLTNIARDVGEDARAGRIYFPSSWLRDAGVDADAWLQHPHAQEPIRSLTARLLAEADRYYAIADRGIPCLPADCRVAVRGARLVYADIGRVIAARAHDSVTARARTSGARKAWLLARGLIAGPAERAAGEPLLEPEAQRHMTALVSATLTT